LRIEGGMFIEGKWLVLLFHQDTQLLRAF
jgi:hypothetical protein